jgi:hypothetical protein
MSYPRAYFGGVNIHRLISAGAEFFLAACYFLLGFAFGLLACLLRAIGRVCQILSQEVPSKAAQTPIPVPLGVFPADSDEIAGQGDSGGL